MATRPQKITLGEIREKVFGVLPVYCAE